MGYVQSCYDAPFSSLDNHQDPMTRNNHHFLRAILSREAGQGSEVRSFRDPGCRRLHRLGISPR